MDSEKVIIEIEGPEASSAAVDFSKIIELELGITPLVSSPEHLSPEDSADTKFDPALAGVIVGGAAVLLAIPAAVLTSLQLKDRLSKKQGFEHLVGEGKKIKETKKLTSIRFRIGNAEIELEKASYSKIIDHLG